MVKRRFQISLRTLFFIVLLFGVGTGGWISWPVRTAWALFDAIETKDVATVEQLVGEETGGIPELLQRRETSTSIPTMRLEPRSLSDYVAGRQNFKIGRTYFGTVERGRVVLLDRRYK